MTHDAPREPFKDGLLKVRRELNHLYTEQATDMDAGLFCREHALHVLGIASALGHQAEICTGCFGLRIPGQHTHSMTNSTADHAWCRVDGIAPVDASLTLKYLWPRRADLALVYGADPRLLSGFELKYLSGCSGADLEEILACSKVDLLVYSEHAVERRTVTELHVEPFNFLCPPVFGPPLTESLGPDIFFAITQHCLRLARGAAKPLHAYRNQKSALDTVGAWYPRAREEMLAEWAKAGVGTP